METFIMFVGFGIAMVYYITRTALFELFFD